MSNLSSSIPTLIEARELFSGEPKTIHFDQEQVVIMDSSTPLAGEGIYLSPAWVDIQVNGFAGINLNVDELAVSDVQKVTRLLYREGVGVWCPTLISGSDERILQNVSTIANACQHDPELEAAILGIHLEGPYISEKDGANGAHDPVFLRTPSWDEFSRWQAAANGRICLVTCAPEIDGAIEFIRRLVQSGVTAAIGHSNASTESIQAAAEAGASLSTHLGNGIPSQINRHSNPIWEQLADDRLYASMIFDGFHLPVNVMRVFLRAKGLQRSILVSDAVSLAHMAPGIYENQVGGKVQLHPNGRLSIYGTEYLAGSASSLKDCLETAVHLVGIGLKGAIAMATLNPLRLLKTGPQKAFTLFQWDQKNRRLKVIAMIRNEKVLYHAFATG